MRGKLYVIESSGLYKIGITKQPMGKRLKDLQTGNPTSLNLILVKHCSNYVKIEKYFHRLFKHKHIRGEWFKLSSYDLSLIITSKLYSIFK